MFTLIISLFIVFVIIAAMLEIVAFVFDWMTSTFRWLFGGAGGCILILAIVMLLIAL